MSLLSAALRMLIGSASLARENKVISGKYLCLAILTNTEECLFSRSTTCLGQTYTCVMIMCI